VLARDLPDPADAGALVDPDDLVDLACAAVRHLGPPDHDSQASASAQVAARLDAWLECAPDLAEDVAQQLAAFRFAVEDLDDGDLDAPFDESERRAWVASYLHGWGDLERAVRVLDQWACALPVPRHGLDRLRVMLSNYVDDARRRADARALARRLWAHGDLVERHGLQARVPTLSELAGGDGEAAGFDRVISRLSSLRGARWAEDLVDTISRVAWAGRLRREDLDAVRGAIAVSPGRWCVAHRRVVPTFGGLLPVDPSHAASAVRAARASVPIGCLQTTLTGGAIDVLWDERGPWCRHVGTGPPVAARIEPPDAEPSGWFADLTLPLLDRPPPEGRRSVHRLGPLRHAMSRARVNADRAYAPRAYVVTLGESALRNLLGWEIRTCATRLHEAALAAGHEDPGGLIEALADDALALEWVRALPRTPGSRGAGVLSDARCLGDAMDHVAQLDPAGVSGELATLLALEGDLRPVDGDMFVLVATETCTSRLASHIVAEVLRRRFPASAACGAITALSCRALVERERLDVRGHAAHRIPEGDVVGATAKIIDRAVAELLSRSGADPVLAVVGGTRWETGPMLQVACRRRVACAYKADDRPGHAAAAIVLRFDQWPPAEWQERDARVRLAAPTAALAGAPSLEHTRTGATATPDATCGDARRWLVMTVGTSISLAYRRGHPLDAGTDAPPGEDAMVAWVEATAARDAEWWRVSAELTGFEAWRRHVLDLEGSVPLGVALIRSRGQAPSPSDVGQVCGRVVARVLETRGVAVRVSDAWDVLDLGVLARGTADAEMTRVLLHDVMSPLARGLDDMIGHCGRIDVLAQAGQKLVGAMLQLGGIGRPAARVYLAPEPEPDAPPRLMRTDACAADAHEPPLDFARLLAAPGE
jgi:hypothetical protein